MESIKKFDDNFTEWEYSKDINPDVLSNDWLENKTSWIYKVGILAAIDSTKCDWAYVAIGIQKGENFPN